MSEESSERVTREQVIAAYKPFADRVMGDPAQLDPDDPGFRAAQALEILWMTQGDLEVGDDEDKYHRHNHDKTMLWIDAGFTGLSYLYDVHDWLLQDMTNCGKVSGSPRRKKTRRIIAYGIGRVRRMIREYEAPSEVRSGL